MPVGSRAPHSLESCQTSFLGSDRGGARLKRCDGCAPPTRWWCLAAAEHSGAAVGRVSKSVLGPKHVSSVWGYCQERHQAVAAQALHRQENPALTLPDEPCVSVNRYKPRKPAGLAEVPAKLTSCNNMPSPFFFQISQEPWLLQFPKSPLPPSPTRRLSTTPRRRRRIFTPPAARRSGLSRRAAPRRCKGRRPRRSSAAAARPALDPPSAAGPKADPGWAKRSKSRQEPIQNSWDRAWLCSVKGLQ